MLVTAFLVFFMQAGFMFLEAGFARSREAVNVLLECIVDTCLCALLFWAFGFAFMFGPGQRLDRSHLVLPEQPPDDVHAVGTGVAFYAFVLFQYAFADTCSTVTSGAMVGRTGFVGDLIYSIGVSGFIYPDPRPLGLGTGRLARDLDPPMPFHDFAGSTVVHSIGGFISLAGAMVLGPRLGRRFKRDGGGMLPPHDLTVAAVGGVILWFGWYGFNPGSTLSAIDYGGIGRVALNTTLAASAAGLSAMFIMYPMVKKWDLGISINGFLAGLVAITCPCYWVNPLGAVIIGLVAGGVVIIGVEMLEWLPCRRPDRGLARARSGRHLGHVEPRAVRHRPVRGELGARTGQQPRRSRGLFYGGGGDQLLAQFIGSFCVCAATFAIAFIMFKVINAFGILRVSRDGELEGLDLHEHGTVAYHTEFGYGMSTTSPPSEDGSSGGIHAPAKSGSSA